MKTQVVVFPDLNKVESSLVCCVFGQFPLSSSKAKRPTGVTLQLAVP